MTIEKKIGILAITVVLVTFAAVALKPEGASFPGLSRTEVQEIRAAVGKYGLPSYSPCFSSWDGLLALPKVARVHLRWHVDEMRPQPDGSVQVRYTVHCSTQSFTNSVRVQRKQGAWAVMPISGSPK